MSNPKKSAIDALIVLYHMDGLNPILKGQIEQTIESIHNCVVPVVRGEERQTVIAVQQGLKQMVSDLSSRKYPYSGELLLQLQEAVGLCNRILQEVL